MSNKELIPVKYKKKFLTPTTRGRAYHLVSVGKAVWFKDKIGTTCIRMKVEPSNNVIEGTTLGVDLGQLYDAYSVANENGSFNLQQTHNRMIRKNKYGNQEYKNYLHEEKINGDITGLSEDRRYFRRLRRNRLRHRKARFSNRIGSKETNTSVYYRQHRENRVKYFKKLFNVEDAIIEDVKFNHRDDLQKCIYNIETGEVLDKYRDGKRFSPMEVGKFKLYQHIEDMGIVIEFVHGFDTKKLRMDYFNGDIKNPLKKAKIFETHVLDAWAMTLLNNDFKLLNTVVHFIQQRARIKRRTLLKLTGLRGVKSNYRRSIKGGDEISFPHKGKLKKIRVKTSSTKSNHGPWNYMYIKTMNEKLLQHKSVTRMNGTVWKKSSRMPKGGYGKSKYHYDAKGGFISWEYNYFEHFVV